MHYEKKLFQSVISFIQLKPVSVTNLHTLNLPAFLSTVTAQQAQKAGNLLVSA
jgi:hypothetical protein